MERVSNDRNRCNNLAKDESSTNIAQKVGSGLGHVSSLARNLWVFPLAGREDVQRDVTCCSLSLCALLKIEMKTFRCCISLAASLCLVRTLVCSAFVAPSWCCYRRRQVRCSESENDTRPSSYETTDASSKGIVSSLTGLINFIMTPKTKDDDQNGRNSS